jgi:hypothetical protein
MRGWTSDNLTVLERDETLWTVSEASRYMLVAESEVRMVISFRRIQPVGTRKQDGPERRGRQPRVYRAIDLIKAYDVLSTAA